MAAMPDLRNAVFLPVSAFIVIVFYHKVKNLSRGILGEISIFFPLAAKIAIPICIAAMVDCHSVID
jgi:hypothetical protein